MLRILQTKKLRLRVGILCPGGQSSQMATPVSVLQSFPCCHHHRSLRGLTVWQVLRPLTSHFSPTYTLVTSLRSKNQSWVSPPCNTVYPSSPQGPLACSHLVHRTQGSVSSLWLYSRLVALLSHHCPLGRKALIWSWSLFPREILVVESFGEKLGV